ncbi:AAA family ATPase [Mycolicibacter minnesotensis]
MLKADRPTESDYEASKDQILVQLARLCLSGREQDVATYLQRVARRMRATNPEVAAALTTVLREAPTRMSPLKSVSAAPMPVDGDSRLPLLRIDASGVGRDEPILDDHTRGSLMQIIDERCHLDRLMEAGLNPSRAALLIGPPGVGKTMAAQWLADKLDLPLAVLDLSSVMSSLLGKTGINLRHAFDYAKQSECVLLLDELDAIGKRRADDSDVGELKRLVTVLLQQIDDWPIGAGLILGATNHPELLDSALWRRFDLAVDFALPDATRRRIALQRFSGGQLGAEVIDILVTTMAGASFNDIERHVMTIRRNAVVHGVDPDVVAVNSIRQLHDGTLVDRLAIADKLDHHGGFSQRAISGLTGISRDTLRKHRARAAKPKGA